ncbi:MAG: hypothetical protein AAGA76_14565, partial [Pseudomonadota bacterium]
HGNGREVIYANHAPVPENSPFVPPVLANCSVFYGDAIRKTYETRSRCISEIILIGQPVNAVQMSWSEDIETVGIFLTALTEWEPLKHLVETIKENHPGIEVLIRHHPVSLLETDVTSLIDCYPDIRTTRGTPLSQDISDCDLVFCGNSGVAMNVLSGGRPVAYLSELDGLPHDYLGFVAGGLTCEVEGWHSSLYEQLRKFYNCKEWRSVMRDHDASFNVSASRLQQEAKTRLERWIT